MRRGRALAVAALVGCTVAPSQVGPPAQMTGGGESGPTVASAPRLRGHPCDAQWVAGTLARVGRIRGLPPKHAVPCVKLARKDLLGLVREHVTREVPPAAIAAEGLEHKLLGLFPADADYEATTYALLEGELAGYYEPADGTMYLSDDLDEELARSTLSHELVHALQDQYWDLKSRSTYLPGQDDRTSALAALAEGEATSAMEDLELSAQPGRSALDEPDDALARRMREAVDEGKAKSAPRALRRELIAPYVDGTLFVHALRRAGGWPAVDAAWSAIPTTTEQVLHVDKWRAHEPEAHVSPPSAPAPDGYTRVDEDTLGEEGVRLTLEEWMPRSSAVSAASGWGGDRMALYSRGSTEFALAWRVRFDAASDGAVDAYAARAYAALSKSLPPLGASFATSASSFCIERKGVGALAVARNGLDLVIAVGAAKLTPSAWASLMTCAETASWAERVAAER